VTVDALQEAITAYAVIPPGVRRALQRDAAVSVGQPLASWPAGQPSQELLADLLAAGQVSSQGPAAVRGLLVFAALLVASAIAVAVAVTFGG
jgi:hypothetical protein